MKVLACVRRVVDYNIKVRPLRDGTGVDLANLKMALNPFCEIAVEEAIRLAEKGLATETIGLTVGSAACDEQLRTSLALGLDRAIRVDTGDDLSPLSIARAIASVVEKEQPDLIILGKQAIDGDQGQTGNMLAGLLGYPQATCASLVESEDGHINVTREVDGGLRTIKVQLPAVVTTDLRLNEPRYASLPNIMKAKRKPIDVLPIADLGVEIDNSVQILSVGLPEERAGGVIVETVDELVAKLRNEAKVL